jgi:zeaxanthin epoxidase
VIFSSSFLHHIGQPSKVIDIQMKGSEISLLALAVALASTSGAFVARPVLHKSAAFPTSTAHLAAINGEPSIQQEEEKYELLGLPARPGRPLRVAIAGGGVGGLTAALCMLKKGFDVKVYEKTSAFARFGGPIQFASNALSVLKEIDESLFNRIMEKFTFTGTRVCGIKDGLRSDGSFRMTEDSLDYLVNPDAPADWFVKFPLKECADLFGLPYTGVIDRPDLQEILIDECKKIDPNFIYNGNPVTSYRNKGKGEGVEVMLDDGTKVDADVLVGADGIWSAVRAVMYGEEIKETSSDRMRRQGCTYSGYTVFAGETVIKTPDYYETGYKVYIGPQRYFVTSDVGDGRIQWYAFFALPPGTKKAPSGWGGSSRTEQADPSENLVDYIKSLHEGWSNEVMTILDSTPPESVEQRDLYDRFPEVFRGWTDGNVCLMGDAVHAMMPNLGQGGCQAIEDAYVLSEVLAATKTTETIEDALNEYYRRRIVRVSVVQFLSRLASDLIINAFDTPWSPHDDLGRSWKSYLTFFWKVNLSAEPFSHCIFVANIFPCSFQPVLQYVIFPLQFAYLYSYHPTGSMKSLPAKLEQRWRETHKASAENAFSRVNKEGQSAQVPSFFQKGADDTINAFQKSRAPATVMSAKKDD